MRSKKNPQYLEMLEEFIDKYIEQNNASPTITEITEGVGLPRSTVGRYIAYMRDQGIIDYGGHRSITTRQTKKMKNESVRVPVLGAVACGVPNLAIENIEEYIRLPVALFGKGDFYILRANGDSMIDAGINDGDLVVIRAQDYASPGQIVVALMEDEATLKRFYPEPEKKRIRLHPENEEMDDIYVEGCIIQGIAVKVLKDLE